MRLKNRGVRIAGLALGLFIQGHPVHATDAKPSEPNAVERTAKKAANATERGAKRAVGAVEHAAKKTDTALHNAAKKTDKALTNAAEKTDHWVKEKTK
jgi:hypothetical protein